MRKQSEFCRKCGAKAGEYCRHVTEGAPSWRQADTQKIFDERMEAIREARQQAE